MTADGASVAMPTEIVSGGDPGVEAFCPRCGARWWIERAAYDAAPPPEAAPGPA